MSKPVAVLISDIHYNLSTLELADAAMRQAIAKANELRVPLIVAGDLHDTKANMRAECINRMIETFKLCNSPPFFIVGNHDKINERSSEHSLNFLREYGAVIDKPVKLHKVGYLIPYYHDPDELRAYLKTLPKGSQLIMHQGVQGSNSGEYIQDKSAITKDDVAGFRVISGHYHARQFIRLPEDGLWNYIGNPYTLNFGEANDPEKGFQILMEDGSLEFVPTNLRKHIVIDARFFNNELGFSGPRITTGDLVKVKVKVTGTKEQLSRISKKDFPFSEFKLELIPTDAKIEVKTQTTSKPELLDAIIDSTSIASNTKTRLKQTWRNLCES